MAGATGPSQGDGRRSVVLGALAGGAVLLAIMSPVAAAAILLGGLRPDDAGRLDLRAWLVLELVVGTLAAVVAGAVSRRVTGSFRAPRLLRPASSPSACSRPCASS